MMNKELEKWFYNKFNSCYLMEDLEISGNFFMIYDEQFIRQRKLSRVLNEEVKMPTEIKGKVLFYQNFKNNFIECNYDEIWKKISNNTYNDFMVQDIILSLLQKFDELKELTPIYDLLLNKKYIK